MLTRLLAVALLAGGLAGLATTALQLLSVQPLILVAETYEMAPMAHAGEAKSKIIMAGFPATQILTIPIPRSESKGMAYSRRIAARNLTKEAQKP